jgi:succinate dehydrogenase/fumarate reductase flavoprotein subunit
MSSAAAVPGAGDLVGSAEFDVVVLGSGAAGLTAALAAAVQGARVGVFEKAELLGGTTTLSGAGTWLPGNRSARQAGVEDSPERAFQYVLSHENGTVLPDLVHALLGGVPEYEDFLEQNTEIRLHHVPGSPDYHPEYPGGMPAGGRTTEPGLVSFRGIEEWVDRIAGEPHRGMITESRPGGGTGVIDDEAMREREANLLEGFGRALIAGLLKAALARGVEVAVRSRGVRLIEEDGAIAGVVVETPEGAITARARAVVLATGGFENDADLVRDFLRGPISRPLGVPSNTGDGLRMAMRVGAQLGNMREAWWCPAITMPGRRPDGGQRGLLLNRESALAGSIMVNRSGHRYMNEAANYNAHGGAFHALDPNTLQYLNIPSYLIFDQSTVATFGVFGGQPGDAVPDWVQRAGSLDGLARKLGLPPDELVATVKRFNEHARAGSDPDFGRGLSAYDRFHGGRTLDPASPFSTLGPVGQAPFYGIEVVPSVLGTKGGPRTDTCGRVLDVDSKVIPGLYAAGNVMASPMGMVYGGAGGTLAVAGIFGLYAGRTAASQARGQRS